MNKLSPADRIMNSILFGHPKGYGYTSPTDREKFEESRKNVKSQSKTNGEKIRVQ